VQKPDIISTRYRGVLINLRPLKSSLLPQGGSCFLNSFIKFLTFNFTYIKETLMKIRPLHDRIVVKRVEEETKTAGGIVLPGSAAEKPSEGEVLAVGSGKPLDNGQVRALEVKVGDRVLFGKYSGTEVKVDGEQYIVMREEDIMGVLG
jgi:chaperonin GroES